jgi:1-acyl-sn-glycerol-3-phosphate acyltransferase
MASITDSDHPFIAATYWILRKIIGAVVRPVLIKRVTGLENIPLTGPAIAAFNHQSFFDFICFASIVPRNVHFLSAEKFFTHAGWRMLMLFTGQIRVNRDNNDKHVLYEEVKKHVDRGTLIGIFPEGTRSPHKEEMLKAFTGVAHFALKHHVPILPVGIVGTYDVMAKHHKKPHFKKIVEIHIGQPMHFHEHYDRHNDKEICMHVTERVIKEIEKLSGKKYLHYESKL